MGQKRLIEQDPFRRAVIQAVDIALQNLAQPASAQGEATAYDHSVLGVLCAGAHRITEKLRLPTSALADCLLFRLSRATLGSRELAAPNPDLLEVVDRVLNAAEPAQSYAGALGQIFEVLLAVRVEYCDGLYRVARSSKRKNSGSFYTPPSVARAVVAKAMLQLRKGDKELHQCRACDPALGAGVFLLELGAALLEEWQQQSAVDDEEGTRRRQHLVSHVLHGVDLSPRAVAVAELALWWFIASPAASTSSASVNLRVGDSLRSQPPDMLQRENHQSAAASGTVETRPPAQQAFVFHHLDDTEPAPPLDWKAEFPDACEEGGFDLVIGNPPWVAFAGRASRPLDPRLREFYRSHFAAWRGYPTLHGLFVERAVTLAPRGVVALLIPSPVADLDGYRSVRQVLSHRHQPIQPMLEFGQDAFDRVVQPCFALVAAPRNENEVQAAGQPLGDGAWRLEERTTRTERAAAIPVPAILESLAQGENLPPDTFRELGFQTNTKATSELLSREGPSQRFPHPLLEGRNIKEFQQDEPRLFLNNDPDELARVGCRLRPPKEYQHVDFVIRQTARVPIAARHRGYAFRNSLLAGFAQEGLGGDLLIGLLNSALYRAVHLALRRDARQGAFPQVKIGHLRSLPAPPRRATHLANVDSLSVQAAASGITPQLRAALDEAVFDLFGLGVSDRKSIIQFLHARAPQLGHGSRNETQQHAP